MIFGSRRRPSAELSEASCRCGTLLSQRKRPSATTCDCCRRLAQTAWLFGCRDWSLGCHTLRRQPDPTKQRFPRGADAAETGARAREPIRLDTPPTERGWTSTATDGELSADLLTPSASWRGYHSPEPAALAMC